MKLHFTPWDPDTLIITQAPARVIISEGSSVPVVMTWKKDLLIDI